MNINLLSASPNMNMALTVRTASYRETGQDASCKLRTVFTNSIETNDLAEGMANRYNFTDINIKMS